MNSNLRSDAMVKAFSEVAAFSVCLEVVSIMFLTVMVFLDSGILSIDVEVV